MDAVAAMEGEGPNTGEPRRVGLLLGPKLSDSEYGHVREQLHVKDYE